MKVCHITMTLLLFFLMSCHSNVGDSTEKMDEKSIEITDESPEVVTLREGTMKTETATVQNIKDDMIILQNNAGETYYIPYASQFGFSIKKDQKLVFSYTEKSLSEEGHYVLTVKWLDDWSHFDQNNFIRGSIY